MLLITEMAHFQSSQFPGGQSCRRLSGRSKPSANAASIRPCKTSVTGTGLGLSAPTFVGGPGTSEPCRRESATLWRPGLSARSQLDEAAAAPRANWPQ